MTRITGSTKLQGVTLGAISSILTTVGTDGGTTGGLTIKGGLGPVYTYDTVYAEYATDTYTLTATEVVYPWQTWVGERSSETNFSHTYSYSPSYAISAMTSLGIFQTMSGFTEAVYAEYVADVLSTPLGTPIMQVGLESVSVVGTGYQASYQVYYTNDGTIVQYFDGVDLGIIGAPSYAAGDVIGMIVYRTATTSQMTWFKNGIYAGASSVLNTNLTFSRTRVNIGQSGVVGYPYGPIRHPVPTPTVYAEITLSSDILENYVYPSAYSDFFAGLELSGATTFTTLAFSTGTTATYSNGNRTVTYPAAIAPWPHVTADSIQSQGYGAGTIYEIQTTVGDSPTTMLSRVGITATGVDAYFDADYGSDGFGNYNAGDTIGLLITTEDVGDTSTLYWFRNGSYVTDRVITTLTPWQLYIDIGENIYRPMPS